MELLPLEDDVGYDAEDDKRDDFLYDLELLQRERSAIINEADTVCRHQKAVLDAGNRPREQDDGIKWPVRGDASLVEFQVSVPRKCHKDITAN